MAEEKNFENKVKDFLTEQGAWFIKYWSGGVPTKKGMKKFTKDGIPDILACVNGLFLAIELKAPDGRPSVLQLVTLNKIRKAYGIAVLLYPKDFTIFKNMVIELSKTDADKEQDYFDTVLDDWIRKYKRKGLM